VSAADDKAVDPVIDEMAALLAQQKLVPFFGAGLSRAHLGLAAAELAQEMADRLGIASSEILLSEVSDAFIDRFGHDSFVDFLKSKLVVSTLDDAKVSGHLLLLSLTPNIVYTANQDNIFELTAAKYGRPYRRIVTVDDLSEAVPGERLLMKFHGDTDVPSSLVFSARSYRARMEAQDHPLDIRLRSDLLGKRLLFLGYSFSDENIAKLLETVQRAFGGKLPQSYLIAFEYSETMNALSEKYGITIVEPFRLFPTAQNGSEAFERCLKMLCDRTVKYQVQQGLETMFSEQPVNPRVVTDYEAGTVERLIEAESFATAINGYRAEFDQTIVPAHLQDRVMNMFRKLTEKVIPTDDEQMGEMNGALVNLRLPPEYAVQATAYVMAACNRRSGQNGFDSFTSIYCPVLPDNSNPSAAAMAVAILFERNEAITEHFRRLANFWFDGWEEGPSEMHATIQQMIVACWQGSGSSFLPLSRPGFLPRKGFHQIMADLQGNFAKHLKNPET
jgi:hypothetical protein